jgi:hypothetical protein
MVHYAATNNGGRAVGAVLSRNQQWVSFGEKRKSLLSGFTSLDHHTEGCAAAGLLFFIFYRNTCRESTFVQMCLFETNNATNKTPSPA